MPDHPPPIFLCQVCDQTPERGHAPDCPGSLVERPAPQKFHCVMALQKDSWEYRWKRPDEESNEDDLVSWEDYLALNDQLRAAYHAHDKRQVQEIEALRLELGAERMDKREIMRTMRTHIDTLARKVIDAEKQLATVTQERDEARARFAQVVYQLEGELEQAQKGRREAD